MYFKKIIFTIFRLIYVLTVVLIFFILRPFITIRVCELPTRSFGHFVYNTSLYFIYKNYFFFDIFCINEHISNFFYLKKIKKKITIFPRLFIIPIIIFIKKYNHYLFFLKKHLLVIERDYEVDKLNLQDITSPFFKFSEEEIKKGNNFLKKIGLNEEDKFICLCIRDDSYLKKIYKNKDFSYHNYRNFNLENFYLVINTLNNLGFKVIRMGKFSDKTLKINNKHMVIDYATMNIQDDMLDFFLFYKCFFCITTSTGMDAPARFFGKPMLINTIPFFYFTTNKSLAINFTKHIYSKKLKRNLKFSEFDNFFKNKKCDISSNKNFLDNEIELLENSPEEWRDYTLEFIKRLNKVNIENDDAIQELFWNNFKSLFIKNIDNIGEQNNQKEFILNNLLNKKIISKISTEFLKKNPEWLK